MAHCPQCGAELKDDYGMTQCPSCSAFLFIDMEGNAFVGSQSVEPSNETPAETIARPVSTEPEVVVYEEHSEAPAAAPVAEPMFGGYADEGAPVFEPPAFDNAAPTEDTSESAAAVPIEIPHATSAEDFAPIDFSPGGDESESIESSSEDQPQAEVIPDLGPANDPLGLSAYANSEISAAKNGPLLFRILISGIDTKEIRESIREVIEDSRFGWDSQALMGQLNKGRLTIERLSPVKAMILINQIKRLPITLRWEQNAVTQIESP